MFAFLSFECGDKGRSRFKLWGLKGRSLFKFDLRRGDRIFYFRLRGDRIF